jgi:hypothetical protein
MTKKNYFLIGLVLAMAVAYAIYFTDWFKTKPMHISGTPSRGIRAVRGGQSGATATPMIFSMSDSYELTEVKVVPVAALKTNKLAQPVWHLIGDPSSDSTGGFTYGQRIDGMSAADDSPQAEPLQPGVMYRIFITAGKTKGQLDFHLGPPPANTVTNR